MSIENEHQKKALDTMEATRRLKLGRDLAKSMSVLFWVNTAFVLTVWLLNPMYIQFLWYGIILAPVPLTAMLQPVFEARGRSTLWAHLFSTYVMLLVCTLPILVPEALLALTTGSAALFLMWSLLLGSRKLFWMAGFCIPAFIISLLVGRSFADQWFPPLDVSTSSIITLILVAFALIASAIVVYLILNGQEKLYRQAQRASMESEQANRAKSVFLANMSHELRTPLNAILGFSQIMARDSALETAHREHIEIINRSGEHLLGLINNVLDMAKIESGHILLQERRFDLYKLLESIAAMFRLRANGKGLSLTVEYGPDVPTYIQMDDGKLRQVLINLLGNAVKFTNAGGIVLRVSRLEAVDRLHFEVEDTGPGIAPEELTTLFEPFSQTASGRQTGEGTGLGLPISRQFVRLMGGELTLSSQPGKGSLFSFDALARSPDASEMRHLTQIKPRVIGLETGQPAYRLLIAEDQADSRLLLVELLGSKGFQVQTASNGQEAVAIWQAWQPHLIWMDMRMPIMNGREATQKIKALPGGQDTIIIALTASSFVEEREQILAEGCNDFIRKPYREEEIFEALARHLKVRFLYENEIQPQVQATPLDLAGLPISWLSQLQKAALEADAEEIQGLAQQISQTHPAIAAEIIRLSANFAYEAILTAIVQAKESI